jgi:hypothetical protein
LNSHEITADDRAPEFQEFSRLWRILKKLPSVLGILRIYEFSGISETFQEFQGFSKDFRNFEKISGILGIFKI